MNYLAVFIGGGLGSVLRFVIGKLVKSNFSFDLPVGTLIANLVSCIIMALIFLLSKEKNISDSIYGPLLLVGFCGGLSTFSTFSSETFQLMKGGMLGYAVLNIVLNVSICLIVFYAILAKTR